MHVALFSEALRQSPLPFAQRDQVQGIAHRQPQVLPDLRRVEKRFAPDDREGPDSRRLSFFDIEPDPDLGTLPHHGRVDHRHAVAALPVVQLQPQQIERELTIVEVLPDVSHTPVGERAQGQRKHEQKGPTTSRLRQDGALEIAVGKRLVACEGDLDHLRVGKRLADRATRAHSHKGDDHGDHAPRRPERAHEPLYLLLIDPGPAVRERIGVTSARPPSYRLRGASEATDRPPSARR